MIFKCPGSQSFSQPHPENVKCPSCGADVEVWSDEVKATCPKCKKTFMREGEETCLDWCKYTKECLGDEIYEKYMQNKTVTMKIKLLKELEDHFGNDKKRIEHAKKVMNYADDILRGEKGDWHIVIPASILHDVSVKEGPEIARKILLKHGFKRKDIEEICEIIAYHHSPGKVNTNNFRVLYDADRLVNLRHEADIQDREKLKRVISKVFLTETGKEIAQKVYLS